MSTILILTNEYDYSTNEVILWIQAKSEQNALRFFKQNFEQFDFSLSLNSKQLTFKGESRVTSVWFRKGFHFYLEIESEVEPNLKKFLQDEVKQFTHSIYDLIPSFDLTVLGTNKFNFYDVNKLRTLNLAREVGLSIPETIVTTNKKEILRFIKKNGKIIAKPIHQAISLTSSDQGYNYAMYTQIIDEKIFPRIDDYFFPSIFQSYIDKNYELRIFFCGEDYYPAAILSQSTEQTSQDFRNYSTELPNRIVPFKLKDSILKKLKELMNKIGLNTGSIDMIVSKDEEVFFLEVNAVGQYGMISYPCNYHLDEVIANYLV